MKDLAVQVLSGAGHKVRVSDLYAMQFNPVAGPGDVLERINDERFDLLAERREAYKRCKIAPEITAEQEKILWADLLIFQCPMWWFSVPAILKGWFDRVLMSGFSYGGGDYFDTGKLKGRRAMLSMTTATVAAQFAPTGIYGDIHERLYVLQHGTFRFCGLDVLPPFVAWDVHNDEDGAPQRYLDEYRKRLENIDKLPTIDLPIPSDFNEKHQLKPGRTRRISIDDEG